MDSNLLVDDQIEDGERLLEQLHRDGVSIEAAFWMPSSDEGLWHLYLVSPEVDEERVGKSYLWLYSSLSKILESVVDLSISHIKLLPPNNPIARAVIEFQRRHPNRRPRRVYRRRFGSITAQDAYIYPEPTGEMTRDAVLKAVAGMMNRSGSIPPATVFLRNGSTFEAIPQGVAVRTASPMKVDVTFYDTSTGNQRVVDADEVSSVR